MGRLKKWSLFNESDKFLINYTDEELNQRRDYLIDELKEIQDDLKRVTDIINDRKSDRLTKIFNTFPDSIFDLDLDQLELVFENRHGVSQTQYNLSNKYIQELKGVFTSGLNTETNQYYFKINISDLYNPYIESLKINKKRMEESIKSITFLGKNLKKTNGSVPNGFVRFGISFYYYHDDVDTFKYISPTEQIYKNRRFNNIEDCIRYFINLDWGHRGY